MTYMRISLMSDSVETVEAALRESGLEVKGLSDERF